MKLNKLFLGAIAALASVAMVACSDDAPDVNNGGENQDGETSYLAVNIVNPSSTGSRATDGGFEDGKEFENEVNEVLFVFFNSDGTQPVDPITWTPGDDDFTTPDNGNGNEEKISVAHLVIKGDKGKVYPTRVLCILNPTTTIKNGITNDSRLGDVTTTIGAYGPYGDNDASLDINKEAIPGKFIMTNSVYVSGNRSVIAANIDGHVYDNPEQAGEDPAIIHVERVVAKVTTTKAESFKTNSTTETVDGEAVEITPEIKGIEVANIANTAYLFKNLAVSYPSLTTDQNNPWWNDANKFRSYWETTPTNLSFNNQSWNTITNGKNWEAENSFYVHPNTDNTKTSVLISATLTVDGQPYELVQFAGAYFTVEGFQNQLINAMNGQNYMLPDGQDKYRSLKADDIFTAGAWKWDTGKTDSRKAYEANIQLNSIPDDLVIVSQDANNNYVTTPADLNALNRILAGASYRTYYWKDGQTYYFKEIEHFHTANDGTTIHGIVRNHIYKLTLNGVTGLGTPVPDGTVTIDPETPTDVNTYLAAQIHILNWKVVKQSVNFGE